MFVTGLREATAAVAIQSKLGMRKKRGQEERRSAGRNPQQRRQVGGRKGVEATGAGVRKSGWQRVSLFPVQTCLFPFTFSPNRRRKCRNPTLLRLCGEEGPRIIPQAARLFCAAPRAAPPGAVC